MPLRYRHPSVESTELPARLSVQIKHLFYFLMRRVLAAELAKLISLQSIRIIFFVLGG
jgi:hypothetical protein